MNERENGYLTMALYERSFGAEASGDFVLPDYQNEIRRILHVSQTVLPPAKYVGDESVEFNGTVDYQVTYIGADGGIYSIPLSSDYSFSVSFDVGNNKDVIEDISVLCNVIAESVNTRVSAPRRLSIRSRLRPNVRIYAKVAPNAWIDADVSPMDVYRKYENVSCVSCEGGVSDVITVSCSVPNDAEDTRVVFAEAKVDVTDVEKLQSGVDCRGNVIVRMLCVGEESGEYKTLTAKSAFEGNVDLEGGAEGDVRVCGMISEMAVNMTETGIECSVGILLQAVACRNDNVEYASDVYSVRNECECIMRSVNSRNMRLCRSSNFTVSERIPLSDTSIPEGAEILYGMGSANMDKCELVGGKYVFSGNAVFTSIYKKENDIYSADVSVPVKYETEADAVDMPACFDCSAQVMDISMKLADGNLSIDAEIGLSADCFAETNVSVVDKVIFGDALPDRETEIVVCYPASDDTAWSVAKRYKVAPTKVLGNPTTDKYVMIE